MAVDAPTYDCAVASDVSYLDVAAVDNKDGMVTVFILNRHLTDAMELDMALLGYVKATLASHVTMSGPDLRAASTHEHPDRVAPRDGDGVGIDDGRLVGSLPPLSYHVLRLRTA